MHWYSYNEGVAIARSNGKKILLNAHAYWCPYAVDMKHQTYSNPSVINFIQSHFVPIQVEDNFECGSFIEYNHEKMNSIQFLENELNVKSFPVAVFCESDGRTIESVPGYIKPNVFLYVLLYFSQDKYKFETLDGFLKQNGIQEGIQ